MQKIWKERPVDKTTEADLIAQGQPKLVARLLSQRNIEAEQAKGFIASPYNAISHPYTLKGVEEAARLFINKALQKKSVAVIGDYDADGIVSSVMIKELCNVFDMKCEVFIPSRLEHGYGLSEKSIKAFKEQVKNSIPDLLIVVDSGSNNEDEIKQLKDFGISSIIIIDHHIVDESKISKSADALVNWRLGDSQEMCACGEVFQFIRGIRWLTKKVNPIEFLSYAAIGTLSDVMPIIGDNRIIVENGLATYALDQVMASGLNSLFRNVGIDNTNASQEDILFKIAPRINAAGRLESPYPAYRLLIEYNTATADLMAEALSECNDERKILQKKIQKEAFQLVEDHQDKYQHGIVVYNPEWHIGVCGIVAARLVDRFHKPSLVIGNHNDILKGSGRSLDNIDLKAILDDCKDSFEGYGGHKLAAGVTLKKEAVDKVNESFNKACEKYYINSKAPDEFNYYDISLKPKALCLKIAKALRKTVYPYCKQFNPEPVFRLKDATIIDVKVFGGGGSVMVFSVSKDGEDSTMQFKMFYPDFGTEIDGRQADVYFSFPQSTEADQWGEPNLSVKDIVFKKS